MFKIIDLTTKKWLKSVPYGDLKENNLTQKNGRVFKRRSDVSLHINNNINFYKKYPDRFEVVEYELVEVDSEAIELFVAQSEERKQKRELADKQRLVAYEKQRNALQGTPPANAIERLLLELQRMRVGWAGENTVPPSDRVNADIERTVNVFPSHLAEPDVDVDPDSGFVTLRWLRLDRKSSFALQFDGSGSVVGVLSQLPKSGHVPWTLHVSDEASLARKFEDDAVKEHLTLR